VPETAEKETVCILLRFVLNEIFAFFAAFYSGHYKTAVTLGKNAHVRTVNGQNADHNCGPGPHFAHVPWSPMKLFSNI